MIAARPAWYKRYVAALWTHLALLSRDAVALHLLLSDLAALLGPLPEDEDELRRAAGVSDALWASWPSIRHLWPVSGLRRGRIRGRMNPLLGEALGDATEACATYRKRAKAGAAGRWKKDRALDASSNASSVLEGMQIREEEKEKRRGEKSAPSAQSAPPISSGKGTGTGGPTVAEVTVYAKANGIPAASAVAFWRYHESKGWTLRDYRPALEKWAEEDAAKAKAAAAPRVIKTQHDLDLEAEADLIRRNREAQFRKHREDAERERLFAQAIEERFGTPEAPKPTEEAPT